MKIMTASFEKYRFIKHGSGIMCQMIAWLTVMKMED